MCIRDSPNYVLREDIRKLDQRIEQMEFIFRNQIQDREQLASIRQEKETEIEALVKERRKFYRYKPGSPQIAVFTDRLRELRHTVKPVSYTHLDVYKRQDRRN